MSANLLCGGVQFKDLRWSCVGSNVKVLRIVPQKEIPDAATDQIGLETSRPQTFDNRIGKSSIAHTTQYGSRMRVRETPVMMPMPISVITATTIQCVGTWAMRAP